MSSSLPYLSTTPTVIDGLAQPSSGMGPSHGEQKDDLTCTIATQELNNERSGHVKATPRFDYNFDKKWATCDRFEGLLRPFYCLAVSPFELSGSK